MFMLPTAFRCFVACLCLLATGPSWADDMPPREPPPGDIGPLQFDRLFGELRDARDALTLTREQEALWVEADKATRAVVMASRQGRERIMEALNAERDKDIIDFGRLVRDFDDVSNDTMRLRAVAREKWLNVYRAFSNEQKALVSRRVRERLNRMKALRERGMKDPAPGLGSKF